MKVRISFAITWIIIFLYSCFKDPVSISDFIRRKWNVISDSSFSGVGVNNHPVNYQGRKGDYFDFRSDSTLYVYENGVLETLRYKITSDTTIEITPFGLTLNVMPGRIYIRRVNFFELIITAPIVYTPGGPFGRKVTLFR